MSVYEHFFTGDDDDESEANKLLRTYMRYNALQKVEEKGLDMLTSGRDLDRQQKALDIELKRKALGLPFDTELYDEDIGEEDGGGLMKTLRNVLGRGVNRALPMPSPDIKRATIGFPQPYASPFGGDKTSLIGK